MKNCLIGKRRNRGFSLIELLIVVAIIIILCGIVFVAAGRIGKEMQFKQHNDYAKTIFMAAQAHLSSMRSRGELDQLLSEDMDHINIDESFRNTVSFPLEDWSAEYYYTSSEGFTSYDMVLPVNSVETHLRNKKVIIEYNPVTGNVYSVFYSEAGDSMLNKYRNGKLPRDKETRRKQMIGYYCGSGLSSTGIDLSDVEVTDRYVNGQEGYFEVTITLPDEMSGKVDTFKNGLDVTLTLKGEISNKQMTVDMMKGKRTSVKTSGNRIQLIYLMDSLADGKSFANLAAGDTSGNKNLSAFKGESEFTLYPGENLQASVEVNYTGSGTFANLYSNTTSAINPMFAKLKKGSSSSKYILTVENGRNLQNLNALTPTVANMIEQIVFGTDINWGDTVSYYNKNYAAGGVYQNNAAEAPGRALPYFVPIHNAPLMGTANVDSVDVTFHNLSRNPVINGNNKKVIGLNIDSTQYTVPSGGEYYVSNTTSQVVHYSLTGLFAFVNSEVKDLTIVNSKIKGLNFASSTGTCATGSLAGVAGYKAFIKNCAVYMERNTLEDYNATSGPKAYKADGTMTWYGVSGEGCVGGLVGYSKSQRLAVGYIYNLEHIEPFNASDYLIKTVQENEVTFYKCFSAVPVSGNMRGNGDKNYGYVNGVGGLVGLTRISNFYGCYASGKVMATGVYTTVNSTTNWSILDLQGKKSMGAGGLVGTSQGSVYWNCFATGDVQSNQTSGTGSFLGVMVYNGKFTASKVDYTNLSLLEDCYTTGKVNGSNTSAFVGGNASIDLTNQISSTHKIYTDYYQMIAPYYCEVRNVADINNRDLQGKIYAPTSPEGYKSGSVIYYYIAKDCYYLDLSRTKEQVDSDRTHIGAAMSYGILRDVDISLAPGSWLTKQWDNILTWTTEDGKTFYEAYYHHKVHSSVYEDFTALKNFYDMQLRSAFDAPWQGPNSYEGETHSFINPGATYGFAMVDGLNYHGEWPTTPLVLDDGACGLAYWEWYADANGEFDEIHAQFDRADTGDLLSNDELREMGAWLVADGYAVVVPDTSATVKIKVGTAGAVTLSKTYARPWTYNGQTVYLYPLTRAVLNNSATRLTSAEDFYIDATITVGSKTYHAFYNPYSANSQVNPHMGKKGWENPERGDLTTPAQIEIRSARQLVGLMTTQTKKYLAEGYNYIQTIDIDASKWTGGSTANTKIVYSSTDKTNLKNPITTSNGIGNAATQEFNGTYTGVGTGDNRPIIANFFGRKFMGLFLFIGPDGEVSNLVLKQDSATTWDYSAKTNDGAGMLADVSSGTIRNVDVVINAAVTLKAKNNAGLLVGKSTGTIENCNVSATAVTLTVTSASGSVGGMVGDLAGKVTDGSVSITTSLTATAANVGGLAGSSTAEVTDVTGSVKALTCLTNNANIGGFVGNMTGGKYRNVNVTLTGTSGSTSVGAMGGMAGLVSGSEINDCTVTIKGSLTASNAAGLAATISGASVKECTVTISGSVVGSSQAAGFVAKDQGGGNSYTRNKVYLKGGMISSTSGQAAGFAGSFASTGEQCQVQLEGASITGSEAAGFAHTVSGIIQDNCAVVGSGEINGSTKAAGFVVKLTSSISGSRVTPAAKQNAASYAGITNSDLVIKGGTVAGFAISVESSASIQNCDALGTISGTTCSGFADSISGQLDGCIANVSMERGSAFVRNVSAAITNCYGWYSGTATLPDSTSTRYSSCYFGDINSASNKSSVVLFDSSGKYSKITPEQLAASFSKFNSSKWVAPGKYEAFIFNSTMTSTVYPYPMLREHCGNWAETPIAASLSASQTGQSYQIVTLMDTTDLSPMDNDGYMVYVAVDQMRKENVML